MDGRVISSLTNEHGELRPEVFEAVQKVLQFVPCCPHLPCMTSDSTLQLSAEPGAIPNVEDFVK